MNDPVTYRQADPADILTICELGQQLNNIHHRARADIYTDATSDFARDRVHWLPSLEAENQAAFLAEQRAVAVGFITVQIVKPSSPLMQPVLAGRIGSVGVSEEQRGRGIGRALMRLAERWASERGAEDLRLTVWKFNEPAIRLYEELGYEVRAFEMGKRSETLDERKPDQLTAH